ncbi:Alpha-acetolactate decarboxylase [Xenorhabdus mauleonii]|uniref:Alpha-acetolactate decarboxylase n=1 Tax=Xenorhabdus mauleonii TaxID=351675 RepID=A0A1I3QRE8_9GAMM|nr:acetolactate decarboxylase [Xenorhabdus mauleonii]PHM37250.1 Alpha-acetolactate decarboxylase [Xenorhabdus mauleonii]SFJ36724.1 acetolactate decarboxylase [Xenorhabdus mauleonii]
MKNRTINQYSTIHALMSGVFDGAFAISEISHGGSFGIGCSHALAGEMIALDDIYYEIQGAGHVRQFTDQEQIPFAQLTHFNPDDQFPVSDISKADLYSQLSAQGNIDNIFAAIRIEGYFEHVWFRRTNYQQKPYRPFVEAITEQSEETLYDISGVMVGFWTPEIFQGISVAGIHIHFIDDSRKHGGHVFGFKLKNGLLSYELKQDIKIHLPNKDEYINADLKIDNLDDIIRKTEG